MIKKSKNLQIIHKKNKVFLFNSLYGNLTMGNENIREFIDKNYSEKQINKFRDPKIKKFIKRLIKNRYLSKEDDIASIKKIVSLREKKLKKGYYLNNLRIFLTKDCNLDCDYCYLKDDRSGDICADYENIKKRVREFFSIVSKNNEKDIYVRFTGGEPLLKKEMIMDIIRFIEDIKSKKKKVTYLINTNGLILNNRILKDLLLFKKKIIMIISMDDLENNDRMSKKQNRILIKNVINLKKHDFKVHISSVYRNQDLIKLKEFLNFLSNIKIKRIVINYNKKILDIKNPKKILDEYCILKDFAKTKNVFLSGLIDRPYRNLIEKNNYFCSAIGKEICIIPDGKITICDGYLHLSKNIAIKKFIKTKDYLEKANKIGGTFERCRGCIIEGFCAGYCSAFPPQEKFCDILRLNTIKNIISTPF
jgi:radical SAM protein with 4Fe4S-binding SPASM domain